MAQPTLFEEDTLIGDEDLLAEADSLDSGDELSDLGMDLDAFEELDSAEGFADEFEDAMAEDVDTDIVDEFGDFALDNASGLFVPQRAPLIYGPAAVAVAQRLNPFVLESMDADDADAFFRRIGRGLRQAARSAGRVAGGLGRVASRVGRVAAPLLRRALPLVQRVAGLAGPWGRVVSAGIGAAQGLMQGRGLRGALAGAVGGLIPGFGGQIASSILGGDGADDDAALDALADMADTGQVPLGVAMPLGAGLAARVATPRFAGALPPAIAQRARLVERAMLQAGTAAGGNAGRRLRVMRSIARGVRSQIGASDSSSAVRALPTVAQAVARRVLAQARQYPGAGMSSRAAAARRLAARRRILAQIPAGALVQRFV